MLTKQDKSKIIELRSQGFSYQAIHDKLGFAVDTIMRVCNENEEKKAKELDEEKSGNAEEGQIKKEIMSHESVILDRKIENYIDNAIKSERLKDVDTKKWEKRMENIRTILDEKVDDVRTAAVETRDEEWKDFIKQKYVKKEVVINLNNKIQSKDLEIRNIKIAINERDNILSEKQSEISQIKASHYFEKINLKGQKEDLLLENIGLKEEIRDLNDFIDTYLDDAGRREQGILRNERDVFNVNRIDFEGHVKVQKSKLYGLYVELSEKLKSIEKREIKLAEQKEKFKKQKERFDEDKKQIYDMLREKLKSIEKHKNKLAEGKDELDAEREKIQILSGNYAHTECIKKKKQIFFTLTPVSYSVEPVVQSGFSPIIRSGGEPMIVMSGLEPVVQSGVPSANQSGKETKVVESSGYTIIQSGYSSTYYFGTENLD